jgi:hypothetical protein
MLEALDNIQPDRSTFEILTEEGAHFHLFGDSAEGVYVPSTLDADAESQTGEAQPSSDA